MAVGDSKLKTTATILSRRTDVSKYTPNTIPVPEELGKSAAQMKIRAKHVGVFRSCVEVRGLHELNSLTK